MKINKLLIALFAISAVVMSGCSKDDADTGVNSNLPVPTGFEYDDLNSSSTTIGVYWDNKAAIAAGATSFTVQITKSATAEGDAYNTSTSQTILSSASLNDATIFAGLKQNKFYFVRVRANYPGSKYSKWAYLTLDGEVAPVKVGDGLHPASDMPNETFVATKLIRATANELSISWSPTEFTDRDEDILRDYTVELFKDAAYTDLVVSWDISSTAGLWSWASSAWPVPLQPSFIFTGLKPSTTYYFRVTDTTTNLVSDPASYETTASLFKTLPATEAAAGDIILYEDFAELVWGGDATTYSGGYSASKRSEATSIGHASGVNPVGDATYGYYLCNATVEMGLFSTIGKALADTRMNDWGWLSESATSCNTLCRPGYLKLGSSSMCAWIVTPEIKCMKKAGTVEVKFLACPYKELANDPLTFVIETIDDATLETTTSYINKVKYEDAKRIVAVKSSLESDYAWKEYTFNINNVGPTTRIAIGTDRNGVSGQHRMYIDNIRLKVVSYGVVLSAPSIVSPMTVTDKSIDVKWNAVSGAEKYIVEYKKSADASWTVAKSDVAETSYTIDGLAFKTGYDVRVKAISSESQSEYSAVATIETMEEIKKLAKPEITYTGGVGCVYLKFAPIVGASSYEVYNAADEKQPFVMTSAADATTVTGYVGGLSLNTAYTYKVKAISADANVASSDFTDAVATTTGVITQIKNNVGPTHVCVDWTDGSGGTSSTTRAFYVELYKDQAMANKVYGLYCYDGQASAGGAFGSSSWLGKTGNVNLSPDTRVVFGQLEPNTTYYFRVKTVNATMDYNYSSSSTVKLVASNGESEFSPLVAVKTEPSHTAVANQIIYQGFDEVTMQSDFINKSAGLTPMVAGGSKDIAIPYMGAWCVYPFANSHVLSTWAISAQGNYIDGEDTHNTQTVYVCGDKIPSLKGWYQVGDVSPHQGYVKVGTSSKSGFAIATPAIDNALVVAGGTPCTISFKACPLMTDSRVLNVEVYHNGAFNITPVTLDAITNTGYTSTDYVCNYKWTTYSVDVTLYPGDNVAFASTDKNRFAIDDILIVKK